MDRQGPSTTGSSLITVNSLLDEDTPRRRGRETEVVYLLDARYLLELGDEETGPVVGGYDSSTVFC